MTFNPNNLFSNPKTSGLITTYDQWARLADSLLRHEEGCNEEAYVELIDMLPESSFLRNYAKKNTYEAYGFIFLKDGASFSWALTNYDPEF